ncbi:hypothetical protein DPMN_106053 [Dreissena polymorpha]|uniref:Uncharacterized protein n=1 Tax=Dreissena polymorpha TaxID=45954 RepID=A0A9D4K4A3_DREPO|nr:hypothetical protein DPMN_106053 [Dreissena polymorpha]
MILGPSVLELSSDNHLVDGRTNRPTYRPTDMSKAIYLLFFERGHNKILGDFTDIVAVIEEPQTTTKAGRVYSVPNSTWGITYRHTQSGNTDNCIVVSRSYIHIVLMYSPSQATVMFSNDLDYLLV